MSRKWILLALIAGAVAHAEPSVEAQSESAKPSTHARQANRTQAELPPGLACEAYRRAPRPQSLRLEKLKEAVKRLESDDFSERLEGVSEVNCLLEEGTPSGSALKAEDVVPYLLEGLRQVAKKKDDFLSELVLLANMERYGAELREDDYLAQQVLATLLHHSEASPVDVTRWIAARTLAELFHDKPKVLALIKESGEKELQTRLGKRGWGNSLAVGYMKLQLAKDPQNYRPFYRPEGAPTPLIRGLEEFAESYLNEEQKKSIPVSHHLSLVFMNL
ncbi:MAG: hypothetical protein R3B54_10015 [Bdellovibrionota bacterium]